MTIKEALDVSNRSVSSREAEIFLRDTLQVERSYLHAHSEQELTSEQISHYQKQLKRREENEPVAYIMGYKEFYGRPFKTDKRALIPRPETEGIIDRVIDWVPTYFTEHIAASNKPCPVRILELGTGSGNIAVTLGIELAARQTPIQLVATDISSEALELAKENWQSLKPINTHFPAIHFFEADLFGPETVKSRAPYHLIVANLPYVPNTWKIDPAAQPEVIFQEPDIALFGGDDGLDIYRSFFDKAAEFLAEDGRILIEYGETETENILKLAKTAFPHKKISAYKDYAELDRILEIK